MVRLHPLLLARNHPDFSPFPIPSTAHPTAPPQKQIPSSFPIGPDALPAGVPTEIGIIFSLDSVAYSINGAAPVTVALTGRGAQADWDGDDTLSFGIANTAGSPGGLTTTAADFFDETSFPALDGSFQSGALWYVSDQLSIQLSPESLTATLTLNTAEGDLIASPGSSYDSGTGVWTATGSVDRINGLLAAVKFMPSVTSPVNVALSVVDGGEGGTVPVTGTLTFTAVTADGGTDSDSGGLNDLLEFAFGTDAGNAGNAGNAGDDTDMVALDGSQLGLPVLNTEFDGLGGIDFDAVFARRVNHGTSGSVVYTVEFSSNLIDWFPSTADPTVITASVDNPDYEIVKIPYMVFLPSGEKAPFFRVRVDVVP